MATSGSIDFSVSGGDIVKGAMRALNAIAAGETPEASEAADGLEALNMLVKQWMAPPNMIAPGLKMWARKHITLALSATAEYTIKLRRLAFSSGGTYTIAVGDTITGATGAATAVICAIEVTSGTLVGGDAAGELIINSQTGTFESETLNVGTNTNVATITTNSTQYGPPVGIVEAILRSSSDQDTPMFPMTERAYMEIADKTATGNPGQYYFEKRTDDAKIYLDRVPNDTTYTIFMIILRPLEDIDAAANDVDFSREWYRPLKYALAVDLFEEYPTTEQKLRRLERRAGEALLQAQSFTPEETDLYFQPGLD